MSRQGIWILSFLSLNCLAGPPTGVSYNNFSATGGSISAPCPSNYSCSPIAVGVGFVQREIIPNNQASAQERYIQTITVDPSATGTPDQLPMVMESFIQSSQSGGTTTTVNGFSGRETVVESLPDSNFQETTAIDNGWADTGLANVRIGQDIDNNAATAGNLFTDKYLYQANHAVTGERTGTSLDIEQGLGLQDGSAGNAGDTQNYSYQHLQGDFNTAAGSISLPNGSVLTWQPGDAVTYQRTNQILNPSGSGGNDFQGSFIQFDFAENQNTNTKIRSTVQADTGVPINANPAFPTP